MKSKTRPSAGLFYAPLKCSPVKALRVGMPQATNGATSRVATKQEFSIAIAAINKSPGGVGCLAICSFLEMIRQRSRIISLMANILPSNNGRTFSSSHLASDFALTKSGCISMPKRISAIVTSVVKRSVGGVALIHSMTLGFGFGFRVSEIMLVSTIQRVKI